MVTAVSYHETVTKLQGLSALAQGPFDRAEWYGLLAGGKHETVLAFAIDGQKQAALPLRRTEAGLESLANWFTFTWRPLVEYEPALHALAKALRKQAYRIEMAPVPGEDGSRALLESAFRDGGWMVFTDRCDENHVLPVEGRSFAEYWSQRPGRMRTTLKRKAKKVSIEILDHFDEVAWDAYKAIYAESWKPEEERDDLLEAFARDEGNAGRIRLGIARHDDVPVAAQFWTVEGGTAYIHKLAHLESATKLSAGTTLTAALFEHVIDKDRVDLVDFGTGSDSYKRDWMEVNRPRYCLLCLDPRQLRAWPQIAKEVLRRFKARLASPQTPG